MVTNRDTGEVNHGLSDTHPSLRVHSLVPGAMTTLSKSWRVARYHASFYTDSNAKLDRSHQQQLVPPPASSPSPSPLLACWNNGNVTLLDLTTGRLVHTIHSLPDDEFTTFAISPSHSHLLTLSRRSSLLTLHSLSLPYTPSSSFKVSPYHSQPIVGLAFDSTGQFAASASLDRTLRVFYLPSSSLSLTLRGHGHPLHAIAWHPSRPLLVSSDTSGEVRVWDAADGGSCTVLSSQHMAPLTSITFPTSDLLLTASRDRVLCLWSALPPYAHLRTIPAYETVASAVPWPSSHPIPHSQQPPPSSPVVVTGGDKGVLRWWDVRSGRQLAEHAMPSVLEAGEGEVKEGRFIANHVARLFLLPAAAGVEPAFRLVVVTMEQNVHVFTPSMEEAALYVGHNDEILDVRVHPVTRHAIVATNSAQVRVFDLDTLSARVLSGHRDVVMGVGVSGDGRWVVTGSKDHTVRLWEGDGQWRCVAVCEGHAESVGCVALSRGGEGRQLFVVSGARDRTVKEWDASALLSRTADAPDEVIALPCTSTRVAHSKDINTVAVSPNDRLIASGSEDRTVHLLSSSGLSSLAVLKGHRRGVWSVRFSPVEKVVASAGGDKTVRLWSLVDYTCLKTLEGHTGSVKAVGWLKGGMQLLSGGDDGVVRLWTVKTSECAASWVVPVHEEGGDEEGEGGEDGSGEKVWALDVSADGATMVTGGVGSVLNVWQDVTAVEEESAREERTVAVSKEQRLMNAIRQRRWKEATAIALELKQPRRLHAVLAQVLREEGGEEDVRRWLAEVDDDGMDVLLTYVKDWNTNAKTAQVANHVLALLFRTFPLSALHKRKALTDHLPGLVSAHDTASLVDRWGMASGADVLCDGVCARGCQLVYCERHFQRVDRLLQRSYLLDYASVQRSTQRRRWWWRGRAERPMT